MPCGISFDDVNKTIASMTSPNSHSLTPPYYKSFSTTFEASATRRLYPTWSPIRLTA
jgi:hypothetical protein